MNPVFFFLGGGGRGGVGQGGSQEGRRLVSVNNPNVIRLFTYIRTEKYILKLATTALNK